MSFLTRLPYDRYRPDALAGFDPARDGYDPGVAHAMAWMCQLAYETDERSMVGDIAALWGMQTGPEIISVQVASVLPMASTQLVACEHRNAIIVGFAGTDPLVFADWVTDLNVIRGPQDTAAGFAAAADAVGPQIDRLLQERPADSPIFVTGHSLGGALAVLAAARINSKHPERVQAVYTFGMPRAGGEAFAAAYNQALGSRTFRLIHGDDVVPTVPPSSFEFRHVGRHLRCGRGEKLDGRALDPGVGSDEPQFVQGTSKQVIEVFHRPLTRFMSAAARLKLVAALGLGVGPSGMRTDVVGLVIELLPPPLRDHMPDRYIEATRL